MEKKTYKTKVEFEWKTAEDDKETGEFKAIFAKFNELDHDQDVTEVGAFSEQTVVIEGWNHDYNLPVGKGTIGFDEEHVWVDGKFFLDTQAGLDHYRTVKNLQEIGEWSYTFYVDSAEYGTFEEQPARFLKKLDVSGVSPVTRGAGKTTSTVSVKNKNEDESETSDDGEVGDNKPSGEVERVNLELDILEIEE